MTSIIRALSLSKISSINHGFFGRSHGLSKDDKKLRQATLARIENDLGATPLSIVTLNQVHSADALVVDAPFKEEPPQADALVTMTPNLYIGILTADCVPILFSTPRGEIVGACHAGWRGALNGIIENTIEKMRSLGATQIAAALGPCIWQQSYEVSATFYQDFDHPAVFKPSKKDSHWQFDLPAYVCHRLRQKGIVHIENSPRDTYEDRDFFSYRRKTHYPTEEFQSNLSIIGIRCVN